MSSNSSSSVNPAVSAAGVCVGQHGNNLPEEFPSWRRDWSRGDTSKYLQGISAA